MLACSVCEASNPDGYRFCGHCGTSLMSSGCPSCGTANPEGQRFCGHCGSDLADDLLDVTASPSVRVTTSPLEERKLATVLFADVVGFTSLAERTDHELVARMVDTAFVQLAAVVTDHGGTIDKYMGDSVMAVFGVPVAHDDDAERAVAAGLAMRKLGGDLVFSVGINSGEVTASAVGRAGVTVIGDTVNVAARLEKAASPGEVLCGRLTAELARERVCFRERRPVLLKGKSEPVEVFEALSLRRIGADDSGEDPKLVGRHEELSFLQAQWRRARNDSHTQFVVVCGEAGSGKTRLLNELARTATPDGLVIRSAYPAYGAMGGARIAGEILEKLGPCSDPEVNARVRSVAGEVDESLQSMDPAAIRHEQMWAFARLLKEKALERPLLLIIDDMHRGDDRTLDLLEEMSRRLPDLPLLTVLAGRTDPADWLAHFTAATTVRLGSLGPADAEELANDFVRDKPLSSEAASLLIERSGGNPLYLREFLSMARAQEMLVDDGASYRIRAAAGIPATLQAMLASRVDALEARQKLVLQHAAVLGEATTDQIARLGSTETSSSLRSLVDSGFLRHGPDGRYQAVDQLLREVAYEMLPRHVRGELHRRAADAFLRPEERARHLERAAGYLSDDQAVASEAADALAAAGRAFIDASRHLDALRLLERAVALGLRDPVLLLELAKLQAMCGKEEDAFETLSSVPDDPGDPKVAAERDHTSANVKVFSDPAWALPRLEKAAMRWHELGETSKEAWAYANAGVSYFYLSRTQEAAHNLEHALELFEAIGDRSGAVSTSSFLCLARPEDRRVPLWLAGALEFADESGDRSKQISILATLAWHHFLRSLAGRPQDMREAEGFALRLSSLSEELGANDMALQGRALLAIMARHTGRLEQAVVHAGIIGRLPTRSHGSDPWLAWAASFSVAVASGASGAAPPFPPHTSPDPVAAMAALVIETELTMSGRIEEALARFEQTGPPELGGPLAEIGGVMYAMALVLGGRPSAAIAYTNSAGEAAALVDAPAAALCAGALRAEIERDVTALPPPPRSVNGICDALVLRAHAAAGDVTAVGTLRQGATALAMPGLLAGLL